MWRTIQAVAAALTGLSYLLACLFFVFGPTQAGWGYVFLSIPLLALACIAKQNVELKELRDQLGSS